MVSYKALNTTFETYDFNVSFLVSCFIFQNTEGALSRSHSVFVVRSA